MTREEAKEYMYKKNDENQRIRWNEHVGIRTLVDTLIDKIYDSIEYGN